MTENKDIDYENCNLENHIASIVNNSKYYCRFKPTNGETINCHNYNNGFCNLYSKIKREKLDLSIADYSTTTGEEKRLSDKEVEDCFNFD